MSRDLFDNIKKDQEQIRQDFGQNQDYPFQPRPQLGSYPQPKRKQYIQKPRTLEEWGVSLITVFIVIAFIWVLITKVLK